MNNKSLCKILSKEAAKGIERMIQQQECSHSFNMINAENKAITVLIVAAPSRLDYLIYAALKPIIEADGKVGTLVEPNARVPRD